MRQALERLRVGRRSSNQLMMMWLRRDLRSLAGREVAVDAGCGRFINRPMFRTQRYVGVDDVADNIAQGKKDFPDAEGCVGSILEPLPVHGDVVVCTLVLHNKRFPHERTLEALQHLVHAVKPGGDLMFTMANINSPYEKDVDARLAQQFASVSKRVYGRFNTPSKLSYVIAWAMDAVPAWRLDPSNRMLYYRACSKRGG